MECLFEFNKSGGRMKLRTREELDRAILDTQHQIELKELELNQSVQVWKTELKHPERYIINWILDKWLTKTSGTFSSFIKAFLKAMR